jgi:hypothetical protein
MLTDVKVGGPKVPRLIPSYIIDAKSGENAPAGARAKDQSSDEEALTFVHLLQLIVN